MVPLEDARAEITVMRSRFIASLSPVETVEAARGRIAELRREFPDATHHVPAYIIGGGASVVEFCSDDGEPSGSSGRPLLAVLKGSGLGNVLVVVTRYFGGTLLGTGGLVRAYSGAGRAVLAIAARAELVETRRIVVRVPYPLFDVVRLVAAQSGALPVAEDFSETVRMTMDVAAASYEAFAGRLSELSAGTLVPLVESTRMAARPLSPGGLRP